MSFAYRNPVWPGYFADPFVWRTGDGYFAYGTGAAAERDAAGRPWAFKILRSRDLAQWEAIGAALPLEETEAANAFWAPELAESGGRFFLYYSTAPAGADERHRLQVAVSDGPAGPFERVGTVLPDEVGFSIDAHPFRDPRDGRWYLFFARDFFDERVGTGIAVVSLAADLRRTEGAVHTVVRANADWQVYERNRVLYGQRWSAWHTVEGPCVVMHDGRYYCFYSGGNWQTENYGVSYAVAEHPLGPWKHVSENRPMVLRQRSGALGPGHNSYALAPDGSEWLVYHAWDDSRTMRRMFIDPLVWTSDGPRCPGPTVG
jgi:beta-xylosidase